MAAQWKGVPYTYGAGASNQFRLTSGGKISHDDILINPITVKESTSTAAPVSITLIF